MNYDVVVVGAGFTGLLAAIEACAQGGRVLVVAQGQGMVNLSSGCIDLLGYLPWDAGTCLTSVEKHLAELVDRLPEHPYARVGVNTIKDSVEYFQGIARTMGYPYQGDGQSNFLLPTAMGGVRPTALVPYTMSSGDIRDRGDTLVVGFRELLDFHPRLIADGVSRIRQRLGLPGRWTGFSLETGMGVSRNLTTLEIARWLEDRENLRKLAARVLALQKPGPARVGLPSVLGLSYRLTTWQLLQEELGCPVFEIPAGQPAPSGMRLYRLLLDCAKSRGVGVRLGVRVLQATYDRENWRLVLDTPGRKTILEAGFLVLATGGVLGRGIIRFRDGFREVVAGLPVTASCEDAAGFIAEKRDPYALAGITVDERLHPEVAGLEEMCQNLVVAGASLAGYDPALEKDGLGVCLATGYAAGRAAAARGGVCLG